MGLRPRLLPTVARILTLPTATARTTPDVKRRGTSPRHGGVSAVAHTNFQFTSESVSEGHPDKVCDQISDAVLDAFLENDIKLGISDDSQVNTRLGCETLATTNKIVIAGEGRGQSPFFHKHGDKTVVNRELIAQIARDVVKDIGYDQDGFSFYGADIEVLLHGQSPDIAMGVNAKKKKGG
jgi:S-adenosylmethionine synthetase